MSHRAPRMLTIGAGLIALALFLPVLERDLALTAAASVVLALPCLALAAAVRVRHVAVSHAAFPASFIPAVIYLPGLFSGPAWAGFGGAATLLAVVVLFGAFFQVATPAPPSVPLVARLWPWHRAQLPLALAGLAVVVGLVATWLPLIGAPPSALATAFGVLSSIALVAVVVGTTRRLNLERVAYEPSIGREQLNSYRSELVVRRRTAVIGITLATLTGLAGLAWYLRRGLF